MTRTSPYSFYTSVLFGEWSDDSAPQLGLGFNTDFVKVSRSEVNHILVRRLLDHFVRNPEHRTSLRYRVPDSARIANGKLVYAIHRDDPENHPRAFKAIQHQGSIPLTPALAAVLKFLRSGPGSARSHPELVEMLRSATSSSGDAAARAYVDRLIGAELLVPFVPVAEQTDDLLGEACAFLRGIEAGRAPVLADALAAIAEETSAFASRPPEHRGRALSDLEQRWRSVFELVDRALPADTPVLYEDTAIAQPSKLNREAWSDILEDLRAVLDAFAVFDTKHIVKRLFRDRFVARYGAGGVCGELEELADLVAPIMDSWFEMSTGNLTEEFIERHPELGATQALRREIFTHLGGQRQDQEELQLESTFLRALAEKSPDALRDDWASYSVFLQAELQPDRSPRAVINHVYDGLGQYVSRYLHLLGAEAADALRRNLASFFPSDRIVAEMRPVAGFNANLHPKLTELELAVDPGASGERPAELQLDELELVHDAARDRLGLRRKATKERVSILYLGFLIPFVLPYRLSLFSLLEGNGLLFFPLPSSSLRRSKRIEEITHYPRIVHRNVVLSRRRWSIPNRSFPRPAPNELEGEYFAKLALWRVEQKLPREVFFTPLPSLAENGGERPNDWLANMLRTRQKPQYLDFNSRLFMRYLGKWLATDENDVIFNEALPAPGGYPLQSTNGRHASEVIVELGRRPPR